MPGKPFLERYHEEQNRRGAERRKLINENVVKEQVFPVYTSNKLFPQAGMRRGIGRSTALALNALSRAILTPNTWVEIQDHENTPRLNQALMFMCKELANELELKHFRYEYRGSTGTARIRCDIFGE